MTYRRISLNVLVRVLYNFAVTSDISTGSPLRALIGRIVMRTRPFVLEIGVIENDFRQWALELLFFEL